VTSNSNTNIISADADADVKQKTGSINNKRYQRIYLAAICLHFYCFLYLQILQMWRKIAKKKKRNIYRKIYRRTASVALRQ